MEEKKTGAKLKEVRMAAGISMPRLSQQTGVSLDSLKSYECGRQNINIARVDIVRALAKALNVPIEKILDE